MSDLLYTVGDTAPSIFGTLTNEDGTAFDLTGSTVRFQMRLGIDRRFSIDSPATVVEASTGSVRYDLQDGDLSEAGDFVCRWQIIFDDLTGERTIPANSMTVEPA